MFVRSICMPVRTRRKGTRYKFGNLLSSGRKKKKKKNETKKKGGKKETEEISSVKSSEIFHRSKEQVAIWLKVVVGGRDGVG